MEVHAMPVITEKDASGKRTTMAMDCFSPGGLREIEVFPVTAVKSGELLYIIDVLDDCRDYWGPAVLVRTSRGIVGYTVFVDYSRNQHLQSHPKYKFKSLTDEGVFKEISLETTKCEGSLDCGLQIAIRPYEDFIIKYPTSQWTKKAARQVSEGYAEYANILKKMASDQSFRSVYSEPHSKWPSELLLKESQTYMKFSLKYKKLAEPKVY
jgi:hypothetical protein